MGSAHFCYHYIHHQTESSSHKSQSVERTLMSVYKPVLQGACSTLPGVVGMLFSPSYAFVIFFKMILIVMFLGVIHSLILVPFLFQFILDLLAFFHQSVSSPKVLDKSSMVDLHSISITHM